MFKRLRWLAWLWLGWLALTTPIQAQTGNSATLVELQTDTYPRIQAYLDVHDAQSNFIHGLDAGDIHIWENGQLRSPIEFEPLKPGMQAVVAINPGESFSIRNPQGVSRFDMLRQELAGWLERRMGSSTDDLSLIILGGPDRSHSDNPADLLAALQLYQFDPKSATPSFELLARAVELAADPAPRRGMERVVLYITAPLKGDLTAGLESLTARIRNQRIRMFIWVVGAPDVAQLNSSRQLRELAIETGGDFFVYTAVDAAPDLESYFSNLRDIYRFAYHSAITSDGVHSLQVEIEHNGATIQSQKLEFLFKLSPPNPVFISPPAEIRRALPENQRADRWRPIDPAALLPQEQLLQVLIEFPDGRPRPLQRTALYVDDVLAAQNLVPPYDAFTWDLSPYQSSGQHILQVEAVDELGLAGRSVKTLVLVTVDLPRQNPMVALIRHWPALAGLTILLAAAIALLGLILTGRIRPRNWGKSLRFRGKREPRLVAEATSAQGETTARRIPGWVNRLHWPQRRLAVKALAFLTPLSDSAESPLAPPIAVLTSEVTLGSDPRYASLVLNDPSVDALHARLVLGERGFIIYDEGSVAGTWVNYLLVSASGASLEHGDLIHLGRACLRFTLGTDDAAPRQTGQSRQPRIIPLDLPQ